MLFFLLVGVVLKFCSVVSQLPLEDVILPDGFSISLYMTDITTPRFMVSQLYNDITITYVGSSGRNVMALIDFDNDGNIDSTKVIYSSSLLQPLITASIAINPLNFNLFISKTDHILICDGNVNQLVLDDELPLNCQTWIELPPYDISSFHGLHYIDFDPNGNLCVAMGTDCEDETTTNCIKYESPYGTIICYIDNNPLTNVTLGYGIRNSVGFDWSPINNNLWFSDNGRDNIGTPQQPNSPYETNNCPDDELNIIDTQNNNIGLNYGYPYCHSEGTGDPYKRDVMSSNIIIDPNWGSGNTNDCSDVVLAYQSLGPHVASLNVKFYTYNMFPDYYKNALFISERGSWNRDDKIGYRIAVLIIEDEKNIISHELFAYGWLNITANEQWGRPTGINWLPDGSMLISDDYSNVIYRIVYNE